MTKVVEEDYILDSDIEIKSITKEVMITILEVRVSIDKRPNIVERKSRVGDWEIDTVIGANHKGVLVTIVDRKSKFALIKNLPSKYAAIISQANIDMLLLNSYNNQTMEKNLLIMNRYLKL